MESEDTFDMAYNLVDSPLEGCRDMFVHGGCPSLGCDDAISNSLERSHVSPMFSQLSFSPEHSLDVPNDIYKLCDFNIDTRNVDNMLNTLGGNVDTFTSLGNFRGYDVALDPYCIYLLDKPRKIMWNTLFDFPF